MPEQAVERHFGRVAHEQATAQHLPRREARVGHLQQEEPGQVLAGERLEADQDAAADRDQRGGERPAVEAPLQGVVEQGHVDRRQHGEQQDLRHRQHAEAAIKAQVGDAELQGASEPEPAQQGCRQPAPAQQRDEDERGDGDADEDGKITVDLAGQVLADQAEREGPEDGDDDQVGHRLAAKRTSLGLGEMGIPRRVD